MGGTATTTTWPEVCKLGAGVTRSVRTRPYERRPEDPLYRPLRIFTRDPSASVLDAAIAEVQVPYEPLQPGPVGQLFEVVGHDRGNDRRYAVVDLEDPNVLIRDGRDPSSTDPKFQQQMVYAVCSMVYAAFKKALGRDLAWGFDRPSAATSGEPVRLRILPHASETKNAYYDRETGELLFGYYRAERGSRGRNVEGGYVFTCLSHDIVAHEVTHALLDGLRSQFCVPSNPDVPAFHEAFADLVAIFRHFSHAEVVERAIDKCKGTGQLLTSGLLTDVARQFGQTTNVGDTPTALRSAILENEVDEHGNPAPRQYDPDLDPHALGSVLVTAVFEAFRTVYKRKVRTSIRLATGGTGVLPPGDMPIDLLEELTRRACRLAEQFLTICIRAIDYCPPAGMTFGDYLRAMITADYDLVREDPWGYREALVDAFQRRGIYPREVTDLTIDALRWRHPPRPIPNLGKLSLAELKFNGDPGRAMDVTALSDQACMLGEFVSRPEYLDLFGLAQPDDPRLGSDKVSKPTIESIRSSRRIGPDGQIVFDLVAEVTQRRDVVGDGPAFSLHGGSTIIFGPRGEVRYVITSSVMSEANLDTQRQYISSEAGKRLWREKGGRLEPVTNMLLQLHAT